APLRWFPPQADTARAFAVITPSGNRVRLGMPEMVQGRPVVIAPETPRAGIYRIIPAEIKGEEKPAAGTEKEKPGVPFAVVPDLRESENLDATPDEEIDKRLGFQPVHLTAGGDENVFSGDERTKQEWTIWVLVAVLAVALVEC